ncbi:thioredoxin-like protein [Cokeromyces recurvatus]|uniref:thioredoxin-like protein n=1 Tax=Cokeromyces recurvatus TaxID=90255 RepID=UPI0022210D68|nr:thioredoxin-like protein [Cokeromyces recurvatus]KAI7905550.1 thioredoxin-like protein [Cokeromyces recurvatus]
MKLTILIFLIGYLISLVHSEDVTLKPDNINELIKSGTWLILHYSPYCFHCRNFAPHWEKATKEFDHLAADSDIHFGSIDCSTQGDLCDAHGIMGYPTVQLWENGEKIERYMGANSYESLIAYIQNKAETKSHQEPINRTPPLIAEKESEERMEVKQEPKSNEEIEKALETESEKDIMEAAILPNSKGISVNLDSDLLKKIASGQVPWFIKFYAPWCPHCRRLAPTWTEMASQLRGQVNVGEVNCLKLPTLCEEFNIDGYPTLQMFGHGEPIDYNDDRSLVSLMKFANEHAGPSVKEVNADELSQYLSIKEVVFVYMYKEKDNKLPELLETVSNKFRSTIPFLCTQDDRVLEKYNISSSNLPVALIAKDNKIHMYQNARNLSQNTDKNRNAFINWIENEQYPLVTKLGPNNQQSILQKNHAPPVVLNIVNAKDAISQSKFRNIAKAWYKSTPSTQIKLIFAEMDRAMWKDYVSEKFKVEHDETAKIIIYVPDEFKYYNKDMNGYELDLDKPEGLFIALKNLDHLKGQSVLAAHEKVGVAVVNTMNWISIHWFISMIVFGLVFGVIYRYVTYHAPKRLNSGNSFLPSFDHSYEYSHKD